MYDIFHEWGSDLTVGSGGDLALATSPTLIGQRICRRLLTNPGDYLWNRDYGGGLAQFVGFPAKSEDIEAVIRDQLLLESTVPTTPAPQVTTTVVDVANGSMVANISYADPASRQLITLNVGIG